MMTISSNISEELPNSVSNEKITRQLNQDNAWLRFLETGEQPPKAFSTRAISKSKPWLMSMKQRRATRGE